jgi:excisionase family DNA binding protein
VSTSVHRSNLLTVQETAELLRQSERTVRRKIHTGEIPAVRLNHGLGPLRIPEGELKRWLFEDSTAAFSGSSPPSDSPERRVPTVEGQSITPARSGPEREEA